MIKVILWDIDGTLLNFLEAEKGAIRKGFADHHLGECTDEMLGTYSKINVRYWQMLERGEMSKPQILVQRFADFFKTYGLDTSVADAFNRDYQLNLGEFICFYPHATETVEKLRGRVLQYAVTNGTKVAQDKKLARSGLGELFEGIFISEEIGAEKPNREFFDRVFDAIGHFNEEEILIVGDSLTSDMRGGVNAGIRTCWFNPENKDMPEDMKIDHVISDIEEVMNILEECE